MSIAHLITRLLLTIWAWRVFNGRESSTLSSPKEPRRLRPHGFLPLVLQVMSVQLRNDQSEGKGTWKDITLFLQLHLSTVRSLLYDPQRSDLGHNQSVSAIMIPSINLSPHDLWARLGPAKWKTQRIFIQSLYMISNIDLSGKAWCWFDWTTYSLFSIYMCANSLNR